VAQDTFRMLSMLQAEFGASVPNRVWSRAWSHAHLGAGRGYASLGELQRARQELWQAICHDVTNIPAMILLGASLLGPRLNARLRKAKRVIGRGRLRSA